MRNVPVVMLVAAVAVLAGVIAVALGRGGELAFFPADYAPLKLDEIAATDVVLFRPPMAAWGYSVQATDEALNRIAEALTERDIEITALRQQVADLEATSPAGRRRGYGLLGRNDRPDCRYDGRPAAGLRLPGTSVPPVRCPRRGRRRAGPVPVRGPRVRCARRGRHRGRVRSRYAVPGPLPGPRCRRAPPARYP